MVIHLENWTKETRKRMGYGNDHTKDSPGLSREWLSRFAHYREHFREYSFTQFKTFCEDCRDAFPNVYYTLEPIIAMLGEIAKFLPTIKICELGGAEGFLASDILHHTEIPIKSWKNWEISDHARMNDVCHDLRYVSLPLLDYVWRKDQSLEYFFKDNNVFISTHVLEHFTPDYLEIFFEHLQISPIQFLIIEMPLPPTIHEIKWEDAHLLQIGWKEVLEIFTRFGFEVFMETPMVKCLKRAISK